tara:strand:+ start:426 stop:797 length:372 start_codon:yes stop_codon:yes gene_type:complete
MSQSTNLAITDPRNSFDQKVQDYFQYYFSDPIEMTDQEYEYASAFFLKRTANEEAAAALTAATIEAANRLGVYIVDIVEQFEASTDLKSAIPTFLNLSRNNSSLLGYEANIQPNENIKRQVEA